MLLLLVSSVSCRYLYEDPAPGHGSQAGGTPGDGDQGLMMIHQLWAEEVRLSLFGQKVGKTTPQHNLRQQSWIEVRAGRSGDRPGLETGDPSDVPSPSSAAPLSAS